VLLSAMSHISLKTPEPARLAAFYTDMLGMTAEDGAGEERVRLGWGRGHYAVELSRGPQGLDHVAFEISTPEEQAKLEERLARAGLSFRRSEASAGRPPNEISILDPDENSIRFHGRVDRSGEFLAGLRPQRIQHIALSTPDVSRMLKFYVDVLGFRVSDIMGENEFVWLRSDHFHHSLALVQRDNQRGLDHFSFDIAGWGDFKTWCDHFARRRISVLWGPGRHGPGNNLFIMFRDSAGFLLEFSAEMELYWDDVSRVVPKQWELTGHSVSLWGPWPDFRQEAKTLSHAEQE